jgi:hypothetical protein
MTRKVTIVLPSIKRELAKVLARHLDAERQPGRSLKTGVMLQLHQVRDLEYTRRQEQQRLDESARIRQSKLVQRLEEISRDLRSPPKLLRKELEENDVSMEDVAAGCDQIAAAVRGFLPRQKRGRPVKTRMPEHVVDGFRAIHRSYRKSDSKLSVFLLDVQEAIAKDHGWLLPISVKQAGELAIAKSRRPLKELTLRDRKAGVKELKFEGEIQQWIYVEGEPERREKK